VKEELKNGYITGKYFGNLFHLRNRQTGLKLKSLKKIVLKNVSLDNTPFVPPKEVGKEEIIAGRICKNSTDKRKV